MCGGNQQGAVSDSENSDKTNMLSGLLRFIFFVSCLLAVLSAFMARRVRESDAWEAWDWRVRQVECQILTPKPDRSHRRQWWFPTTTLSLLHDRLSSLPPDPHSPSIIFSLPSLSVSGACILSPKQHHKHSLTPIKTNDHGGKGES